MELMKFFAHSLSNLLEELPFLKLFFSSLVQPQKIEQTSSKGFSIGMVALENKEHTLTRVISWPQ